jgi:hypothetical protein
MKSARAFGFPMLVFWLVLLPSCRYIRWAKKQLPQASPLTCQIEETEAHIRSLRIYDQFDTIAHFDILWLSNEVRCQYAKLYAVKHGLCAQRYEEFERRQLEENSYFVSFYVLASMPSWCRTSLADPHSEWSLFMRINDAIHHPVQIKQIENLPQEYALFFGPRFNKFKQIYCVKFDAVGCIGNCLFDKSTNVIELWLSTTTLVGAVRWYLAEDGRVLYDCKKERNMLAYDLK